MDKDHLIELISNSLICESKNSDSTKNLSDFKNYLARLNLDQLRTMSKEFITQIFFYYRIATIKFYKEHCQSHIMISLHLQF